MGFFRLFPMRQILALLFCALLLTACGPKLQPPREVLNVAYRTLDNALIQTRSDISLLSDIEYSIADFRLERADVPDSIPASEAFTSDKWCIGIEYFAINMLTPELDNYGYVQSITKSNDGWESQPLSGIVFMNVPSPYFDGLWRDCMAQ